MRCLISIATICLLTLLSAPSGAQVMSYDVAGRLQTATYPDGSSINYEYDANSNITRIRYQASGTALPPEGVIDEPIEDISIRTGESVTFESSGTDPDGAIPLAYSWDFDGGADDSTEEDPGRVSFDTAGRFVVQLTVTDATGIADPTPDSVIVTVSDAPAGGGGTGNGGSGANSGSGSGGGAVLWLPLILIALLLKRAKPCLVALILALSGAANAGSWFEMASGTSEDLRDVWMHSPSLAYAVGDNNTVLRFDGNTWEPVDVGATAFWTAVWGTGPEDIYIAGGGLVQHYDGASWSTIGSGIGTNDIWTAGPGQTVFAVGVRSAWQYNGTTWSRMIVDPPVGFDTLEPDLNITAVRGVGDIVIATANDNFGTDSALLVYSNPGSNRFEAVAPWHGNGLVMFDQNNAVTAGNQARRLVNGTATELQNWTTPGFGGAGVWGTAHDNLWSVGSVGSSTSIRYRSTVGDSTNPPDSEQQLFVSFRQFTAIHGSDENNVMAVGTLGIIYAYLEEEASPTAGQHPYSAYVQGNVNTFTGEVVYETTDIVLNTRFPLEFRRYYASRLWDQRTVGGGLSDNWTHNYEWRMETDFGASGDQARVVDYRGREYIFDRTGTEFTLNAPKSANVGLALAGPAYIFFDRDTGLKRAFFSGQLGYIEDRNGNRHQLLYNGDLLVGVSNGGSGLISLEYGANGRIERVFVGQSSPSRLDTAFSYEGPALATATSPSGVVTRYAYEDNRRLTSIEIGSGTADAVVEKTWEYDDEDRVSATVLGNGGRFELGYLAGETIVLGPDSWSATHRYLPNGELFSLTDPLGAVTVFEYDSEMRNTGFVEPGGRATRWAYDSQSGRVRQILQAGGYETSFTYSPETIDDGADFYDLDTVTLPSGASIVYGYDDRGNNEFIIDELTNVWTFEYNGSGDLIRSENPAGGVTTFGYFSDGQLRSVLESNGNQRLYSYDPLFRLEIETIGRSANFLYSTRFVPDSIRERNGTRRDYTFNAAGYVSRVDVSDGYYEEYTYDSAGRMVSVNVAGNALWTIGYDPFGRPAALTDPASRISRYRYDENGRLKEYTDFEQRVWRYDYRADGDLMKLTRPSGVEIQLEHNDARGLLTDVVDGLERLGVGYDAMGRLQSFTDARERVNLWQRNPRGDVERITDSDTNSDRQFDSDVFGNISRYTDPLGGVWQNDYGIDGLLDSTVDPLGNSVEYGRDREGRIDTMTHTDGLEVNVEYATSGRPSRVSASDGTDVELDSSNNGRIVGGTNLALDYSIAGNLQNSNGIVILYTDDDRIRRIEFASGKHVEYEYGTGGAITIRDWEAGETSITTTDVGKTDTLRHPNGVLTSYAYDNAARITEIDFKRDIDESIGTIRITRDVFGRVTRSDKTSLKISMDVNNDDRKFSYDLASQIEGGTYDSRGNQLRYDGTSKDWNALNRITSVESGLERVAVSYDAVGRITRLSQAADDVVFVQNYALGEPRVSIERSATGADLWYYVHAPDGRLLYRIDPIGNRQFYHFDENGNTVFLTDDSAEVIQSYVIAPHGEPIASNGDVDNRMVTSAEDGAVMVNETDILWDGGNFIDLNAGHRLSRNGSPSLELETTLSAETSMGRSVTPGTSDSSYVEDSLFLSRASSSYDEAEPVVLTLNLDVELNAEPSQRIAESTPKAWYLRDKTTIGQPTVVVNGVLPRIYDRPPQSDSTRQPSWPPGRAVDFHGKIDFLGPLDLGAALSGAPPEYSRQQHGLQARPLDEDFDVGTGVIYVTPASGETIPQVIDSIIKDTERKVDKTGIPIA